MTKANPASLPIEPDQTALLDLGRPRRVFAMGLMVVSSIAISFGGLIVRSIEEADSWQINFYRSLTLAVTIALILVIRYRRNTISYVCKIGGAGLFGGVILAIAGIAFLQALTHTTIANALFTLGAIPFITAVLARVFLKEGLRRATLITMLVAGAGIFVMMVEGFGIGSGYGNSMALVTAICFSGYAVIVRHNRHIDMIPTLLIGGVLIALAALIARFDDLGVTLNDFLLCFLWGGVLSGFANWMFVVASRHLVAAEVTLFMLLEFALGPVWVWLFINEVPTRWTVIGGFLVIASVTVRALIERRRTNRPLRRGRPSPI